MRTNTLLFFAAGAALFLAVAYFGATHMSGPAYTGPATPVAFTELASGNSAKVTTRDNYLITQQDQLEALWALLGTNAPLPSVDFAQNDVIALFAGNEPTAGYSIKVTKITDTNQRMVEIEVNAPGPTCVAAHTVTTPYQVLLIPKTNLAMTHRDTMTTTGCL